jgi:hypothetical protein
MKWDYKTVVLTGGFMGRHKEELRRDFLEQQFDQLGAEGRELALVLMGQALHKEKDGHVVIFKRPLPEDTAEVSSGHQSAEGLRLEQPSDAGLRAGRTPSVRGARRPNRRGGDLVSSPTFRSPQEASTLLLDRKGFNWSSARAAERRR